MLSIVIPVFNEEESLRAFFAELKNELMHFREDYEVLFIDDGSTDATLSILKGFAKNNRNIRIFSFRRNQGKAEALTLGFQKAKGDQIFTLDADLQDKPSEMQKFIEKSKEGIEVVCGWRKNRRDRSKMKIISHVFNFTLNKLFDVNIHDYNCGFKLYTSEAAKSLHLYGGLHRFVPLLVQQEGFSVDEVVVDHQPRRYGKSKYGFSKLWKDLPDMFTMIFLAKYSKRPLHFFGLIGGVSILLGFLFFGYLSILWLMGESIGRRPLLLVSIFLMLGGLQIFFTGFLAELMINIHQKHAVHFPLKYKSDRSV